MSEYPEHDKLKAHREEADTLTQLWDWMRSEGIVLAKWGKREERAMKCICTTTGAWQLNGLDNDALTVRQREVVVSLSAGMELRDYREGLPVCEECNGSLTIYEEFTIESELEPLHVTPEKFIGAFLDIDPQKLSDEKDAMLAAIRAAA